MMSTPHISARAATSVRSGFTLIEVMIAVGIVAVILSIGIPSIYQNVDRDSIRKASSDILEACSTARARAILDGTTTEIHIRPAHRNIRVTAAGSRSSPSNDPRTFAWDGDTMVERTPSGSGHAIMSIVLSPSILIEGVGINGEDWTEEPESVARFYPNGTCDEMSIIILSDKGERRNIFLEVVTGFADFETDPQKFRAR